MSIESDKNQHTTPPSLSFRSFFFPKDHLFVGCYGQRHRGVLAQTYVWRFEKTLYKKHHKCEQWSFFLVV